MDFILEAEIVVFRWFLGLLFWFWFYWWNTFLRWSTFTLVNLSFFLRFLDNWTSKFSQLFCFYTVWRYLISSFRGLLFIWNLFLLEKVWYLQIIFLFLSQCIRQTWINFLIFHFIRTAKYLYIILIQHITVHLTETWWFNLIGFINTL